MRRNKDMSIQRLKDDNEKAVELLKNEQSITEEKQNFQLQKIR